MKKFLTILLLVVCAGIVFFVARNASQRYTNATYGISFDIPSGWYVKNLGAAEGSKESLVIFSNLSQETLDAYEKEVGVGQPDNFLAFFLGVVEKDSAEMAQITAGKLVPESSVSISSRNGQVTKEIFAIEGETAKSVEYRIDGEKYVYFLYGFPYSLRAAEFPEVMEETVIPSLELH